MRRSKLESWIAILQVLAEKGPSKLTHVMYKANVNCSILKDYIDELIKNKLVEEQVIGKKRVAYAITQSGLTVLKNYQGITNAFPQLQELQGQRDSLPY